MALSQIEKVFNNMSKGASRPTIIVLGLFLVIGFLLFSYDKTFKSPVDTFSEYPAAHNAPTTKEVIVPKPVEKKITSLNNDLLPKTNNSELINNNLYFFEISLAAVLFPLADSPSQAIINFLNFFTKT